MLDIYWDDGEMQSRLKADLKFGCQIWQVWLDQIHWKAIQDRFYRFSLKAGTWKTIKVNIAGRKYEK